MKKILFQGDSITDWFRNQGNDALPGMGYAFVVTAQMSYEHPGEYQFVNRGNSGDRVVDVYARMKKDILNVKPDVLSIFLGVNDAAHDLPDRMNGVEAERFERVYDMLISDIRAALPDVKIMLITPFVTEGEFTCNTEAIPDRWEFLKREVPLRAEAVKRLAEKYGLPLIETQPLFDEACKRADATYWVIDGVHPTGQGHQIIARAWMETFNKHFA